MLSAGAEVCDPGIRWVVHKTYTRVHIFPLSKFETGVLSVPAGVHVESEKCLVDLVIEGGLPKPPAEEKTSIHVCYIGHFGNTTACDCETSQVLNRGPGLPVHTNCQ